MLIADKNINGCKVIAEMAGNDVKVTCDGQPMFLIRRMVVGGSGWNTYLPNFETGGYILQTNDDSLLDALERVLVTVEYKALDWKGSDNEE